MVQDLTAMAIVGRQNCSGGVAWGAPAANECVICLEELGEESAIRTLEACGHRFHAACVDRWLEQDVRCPVCRLSTKEGTPRVDELTRFRFRRATVILFCLGLLMTALLIRDYLFISASAYMLLLLLLLRLLILLFLFRVFVLFRFYSFRFC